MKELTSEGKEFVDGKPIEIYDGKFRGSFGMTDEEAGPISSGDEVSFIVTGRAGIPSFSSPTKVKGLKRTNVFSVETVMVVDNSVLEKVLDNLDRKDEEF